GSAALLSVPVGEECAFFGDAVDVGGAISHGAVVVCADVEPADVVAPDNEDIGFCGGCHDCPPSNCVCDRAKPSPTQRPREAVRCARRLDFWTRIIMWSFSTKCNVIVVLRRVSI